jgi:hypothetical protein
VLLILKLLPLHYCLCSTCFAVACQLQTHSSQCSLRCKRRAPQTRSHHCTLVCLLQSTAFSAIRFRFIVPPNIPLLPFSPPTLPAPAFPPPNRFFSLKLVFH